LLEGIGDTLRVSLTGDPEDEVYAGYDILRAVGYAVAGPEIISCPTCGRTQYPCTEIANEVEKRLQGCKKSIKVAVMGCVVNGPGEAREADIGIAGGKGEAVLFIHGKPIKKLTGDNILDQFMDEIYKL
jgi:(E)-4-hydroxy-3-methylbut-2-enyl-diphosphate synthase